MKLSSREKKLFIVLISGAVLFGYANLLLFPTLDENSKLVKQFDELQAKQTDMLSTISMSSGKKDSYEAIMNDYAKKKTELAYKDNEEIDRIVSGLCNKCGLKPIDFSVSTADFITIEDKTKTENEPQKDKVLTVKISLRLKGESSGVFIFTDEVEKTNNLFIDKLNINLGSDEYSTELKMFMMSK